MVDFRKFLLVLLFVQDWLLQSSVSGQSQDTFMNGLGRCDVTFLGCACKDSCINPRLDSGRSKLPWCEVEESCWALPFLTRKPVGGQLRYVDFCLPGCEFINEQEMTEIEQEFEQKETVGGCKCAREWYYGDQKQENCANPDNDPLGSWCVVDKNSCSFHIQFFVGGFFVSVRKELAGYCLQKDQSEEPVAPSFPATPRPTPTSTPTPSPTPTPVLLPTPTPTPTPTLTPTPTPSPIKDDCESLITILNNTAEFSTFNEVLMETGFDQKAEALTDQTILVPDNEAWQKFADFQKIDVGDFFLFQSNIEALREIAKLHFVTEVLDAQELTNTTEKVVQTQLTDQSLTISSEKGQIFIEPPNAAAGLSQIIDKIPEKVCEGQFFRVDTVLTPQIVV